MKKNNNYKITIFLDTRSKHKFIMKSNIKTDENIKINNNNFPLKKIEISSKSHPSYIKTKKLASITGRIEKFKKKYNL